MNFSPFCFDQEVLVTVVTNDGIIKRVDYPERSPKLICYMLIFIIICEKLIELE
jgi:hypothetical protein